MVAHYVVTKYGMQGCKAPIAITLHQFCLNIFWRYPRCINQGRQQKQTVLQGDPCGGKPCGLRCPDGVFQTPPEISGPFSVSSLTSSFWSATRDDFDFHGFEGLRAGVVGRVVLWSLCLIFLLLLLFLCRRWICWIFWAFLPLNLHNYWWALTPVFLSRTDSFDASV